MTALVDQGSQDSSCDNGQPGDMANGGSNSAARPTSGLAPIGAPKYTPGPEPRAGNATRNFRVPCPAAGTCLAATRTRRFART
eukprot:350556-Chlamydomonas_euryale.AAC.13